MAFFFFYEHLPSGDSEERKRLVAERTTLYKKHLKDYKRLSYNETEVRVDFVNPLFKALGWDVDNEAGLPQHLREVIHEATVAVDEDGKSTKKKPDYSFRIGTETLFYLETKKPSVNISTDNAPAFQLRRYGWSGNLKISVLTNYTDLYIYDCSVRPVEGDDVSVAMIAHYTYQDYVDKFDEIYSLISKEAVLSGSFEAHFSNIRAAIKREPFDEYFLNQIQNWRLELGKDISHNNSNLDIETLNISVQRVLNKILFLRICEDRSFEQYELLKNVQTFDDLKKIFFEADSKYDSGLFSMLAEDDIIISDSVIIDIFKNLYYPNSSYEFGVMDPFIIGQIYELFLDEMLVEYNGTIGLIKKPEAVDSQGAVNTPKNITDIIVEQTLTKVIGNKTADEVLEVRIADICCGSGNFLLSAYEFIVNYCLEWYIHNDKEEAIKQGVLFQIPGSDCYRLSFEYRRTILTHCVWGVDIDPLAVEVSKFSLFIKLLENTSLAEIDSFSKRTGCKVLPNMDRNIKNGNSLVDMAFAKFQPDVYTNTKMLEQIKMFDWNSEFENAGFDAIIGNPPYIRVQNMVKYSPDEYRFYRSKYSGYQTACADALDKYYLFIERAWQLLNKQGIIGYIVPHKFMNIKSGRPLRKYLSERESVKSILHFGTHQVFKKRSTYTCIIILSKEKQKQFSLSFVQDWNRFLFEHNSDFRIFEENSLNENAWAFLPNQIDEKVAEIMPKCTPLEAMAKVFVGVQTSADKIYIIEADNEDNNYVYFTDKAGIARKAEKGLLRRCLYDTQITKYEKIEAKHYIIFPYTDNQGKIQLISQSDMKKSYPEIFSYLSGYRSELDSRKMTGRTDETWFAYGRSQSLKRFVTKEHLVWPVLSLDSNYVFDNEGIVFTGGGNGPYYGIQMSEGTKESIFYVQAVLNHWLLELLVKQKASMFRGGYYSHGKQFVEKLPIYRIDWNDTADVQKHDAIVQKVHSIEQLITQMKRAKNTATRNTIERAIVAEKDTLNSLIDELYNVAGMKMENVDESD